MVPRKYQRTTERTGWGRVRIRCITLHDTRYQVQWCCFHIHNLETRRVRTSAPTPIFIVFVSVLLVVYNSIS